MSSDVELKQLDERLMIPVVIQGEIYWLLNTPEARKAFREEVGDIFLKDKITSSMVHLILRGNIGVAMGEDGELRVILYVYEDRNGWRKVVREKRVEGDCSELFIQAVKNTCEVLGIRWEEYLFKTV